MGAPCPEEGVPPPKGAHLPHGDPRTPQVPTHLVLLHEDEDVVGAHGEDEEGDDLEDDKGRRQPQQR